MRGFGISIFFLFILSGLAQSAEILDGKFQNPAPRRPGSEGDVSDRLMGLFPRRGNSFGIDRRNDP
jgi:hypothetical protein